MTLLTPVLEDQQLSSPRRERLPMENGTSETIAAIEVHIQALRRFARSLLRGDRQRADDLVQDSLERALAHWHKRRQDGDLRGWLFTILYNRFVTEQYRRRREAAHRSLDDVAEEGLLGFDGAQEPALEYRDLLRGFAELPQEQQAVLLLIGAQDFSYDDAARILGIPVGTVMSRVSRGRERLRRYMNEGPTNRGRKPSALFPAATDWRRRDSAADLISRGGRSRRTPDKGEGGCDLTGT
jgi:RNA polymerase sigma-70 factor, ECF subfamily